MAKINQVVYPSLGTATELFLKVSAFDMEDDKVSFSYFITSDDPVPALKGMSTYKGKKMLLNGTLDMDATDYANWGADNNYCIEWAANKLGLTLETSIDG